MFNFSGNATYSFTKNLSFRTTRGLRQYQPRLEEFYAQYSPNVRRQSNLPYINIGIGQPVSLNNSNVLS